MTQDHAQDEMKPSVSQSILYLLALVEVQDYLDIWS